MGIGIRCLLADSESEALSLARQLDQLNAERQAIQGDMQHSAEAQADEIAAKLDQAAQGLCVFDAGWHQGVVGLVGWAPDGASAATGRCLCAGRSRQPMSSRGHAAARPGSICVICWSTSMPASRA